MDPEARIRRRERRHAERAALTDLARCPACGSSLTAPRCGTCGVDLSGSLARQLWDVSTRAATLLTEREALLERLELEADARARGPGTSRGPEPVRGPGTSRGPEISRGPEPVRGPEILRGPGPAGVSLRRSLLARIGVQGAFVALGALLLAVAGVLFLVVSWDRLSLGTRALVIAVITGAAMSAAVWLRPHLAETAEAIGGVAVVLVLADAWAVRETGLFGADRVDGAAYGALAATVIAVVLLGWGIAGGVRAGSVAASVVGPVVPVLLGIWLAGDGFEATCRSVCLGLVGAVVATVVRHRAPHSWQAERQVLRVVAVAGWAAAFAGNLVLVDLPGSVTSLLGLLAVAALLQIVAEPKATVAGQLWSATCGAASALAAAEFGLFCVDLVEPGSVWGLALAPALSSGLAWAHLRWAGRAGVLRMLDHRRTTSAARAVSLLVTTPAAVVTGLQIVSVVVVAVTDPWSASPETILADLTGIRGGGGPLGSGPEAVTVHLAGVIGLIATAALLGCSHPHRWAPAAAVVAELAAVGAPYSPRLTVPLVAPLLMVVSVASAFGALQAGGRRPVVARACRVTSGVAGGLGVLVAWAVRETSVPATLAGVGGLLLVRLIAHGPARAWCLGGSVAGTAAAAGAVAGIAGWPLPDRLVVAAVVAGVLAAAAVAVPLGPSDDVSTSLAERRAAAFAGLGVTAVGVVASLDAPFEPGRLAVVLTAVLVVALSGAARRPATAPAGPEPPVVFAAVVAPLASAASASAGAAFRADLPDLPLALVAAGVVMLSGAGVALFGLRLPDDVRRRPAELGAVVTGVLVLLAGVLTVDAHRNWLLWLLLGAGATAAAVPADRRRWGWAGWVLLTLSSWARLFDAGIELVEAYTVPPAMVLLAVAAVRSWHDRSVDSGPRLDSRRHLVPGLTLALLPSLVASQEGSAWRPAALLVLAGAGLVLAGLVLAGGGPVTAWRVDAVRDVAFAASTILAAGVALLRPLTAVLSPSWGRGSGGSRVAWSDAVAWSDVEIWSLPGAFLLVAAGLLVWRTPTGATPAGAAPARATLMETLQVRRRCAALPAVVAAALPGLLAVVVAGDGAGPGASEVTVVRASALLLGGGLLAVVRAIRPRAALLTWPTGRAASAVTLVAAWAGWRAGIAVPEAWTVPASVVLLAVGVLGQRRVPDLGSWRALGPGVALLLVPSLLLAARAGGDDHRLARILLLTGVAAAVVVAGGVGRRRAPVVLGGLVLVAHAVVQLAPWAVSTVAGLPRWVVLGAVGTALLALGATYEWQLREIRQLRGRISALR
ncbi:MAG: hypothetical protein QG622_105 [Actinomycetota bacterium]|nr:hypothetical protein [Actinomycetota bacterium]